MIRHNKNYKELVFLFFLFEVSFLCVCIAQLAAPLYAGFAFTGVLFMPPRPPLHSHPAKRSEAQRKKDFDRQRPSSSKRGYNAKWRAASKSYLFDNPLCVDCRSRGIIKSAECVDHIIPHKGDMKLFWSRRNWQALCHSCHSRKTAKEDSSFIS